MGQPTKINLVKESVIAIRSSLDAYRREPMKEMFVQFATFEVVRAVDKDLSKRLGDEFSSNDEQQRLVAILFALKELGWLTSHDRGRETSFYFDPKENWANDVLRIRLKKSEMIRSIKLSKRILPTLNETWRRADGLDNRPKESPKYEVELDPFVSQLARWVDKEITTARPEFNVVDLGERVARICLELQQNGVAIRIGTEVISMWVTAAAIDRRIGGAKVLDNVRFTYASCASYTLVNLFKKTIKEHLKRRLASMLESQEAAFQLLNMGKLKIASIDSDGQYCWDLNNASLP